MCGVGTGDSDCVGEFLLQGLDDFFEGAEDNQWLSVGEEILYKVGGLPHLAFCGEGAECHEFYEGFHSHLASFVAVGSLGVFAEICGEVCGGEVVFVAV